jgi:predicted ester cyclase
MVSLPDYNHTIEDVIAQGDKVVIRATNRGTHEGEFLGIPPTGKKVEYTGILIGRFVDGKLAEGWSEVNILGINMQLGMELKPKEEK